ncbi:MAG TPA: SDR family oxidoreductase [Anaeromyxobacteraceae bacterium]|nr:SDR family oxidoreductase [Anaeromyxobacteraceae bacterium]
MNLAGAGVIVTGGGRGIGAAAARALTALGARVTVFARTAGELDRVVLERAALHAVAGDVAREDDVARLFAEHARAVGDCDVLVNDAGITDRALAEELSPERFRRVIDVNLVGPFLCARAAIPGMKARRRGRIVNVASISATLGSAEGSAYNASKWALVGLTKCLAEELRPFGAQCLAVSPGSVDTAMLRQTPYAPEMTPEDVARVIAWCAGEAPDAMTGANVEVFG